MSLESELLKDELIDGRYEVRRLISSGSFGTVFLAHDKNLSRQVALKVVNVPGDLSLNQEFVSRLMREAHALSLLKHPGLVEVYRLGFLSDKRPFLAMEFIEGKLLAVLVSEQGPMTCRDATELAIQLAEALSHTHKHGVLHRDIKPENILIETTPSGLRARLVDFGLGAMKEEMQKDISRLTVTGATVGTPQYMCPEQCRGETLDERSDIYSLGLVFFEMLAGVPAFGGDDPGVVYHRQLNEPLPKFAHLDRRAKFPHILQDILDKATAKAKQSRYQSMDELLADLHLLAKENSPSKIKLSHLKLDTSTNSRATLRRRLLSCMAAIFAIAIIAAAGFLSCLLTERGRQVLLTFVTATLPSRQALPLIDWLEKIAYSLRGPSGAVGIGQTALNCNATTLWSSEERFQLQAFTLDNAGVNPPIDVCFTLALSMVEHGPNVIPIRLDTRTGSQGSTELNGRMVMEIIQKTGPDTMHYIIPSQWPYLRPLTKVSQYLLQAQLSPEQWKAVNAVTSNQGMWRWDLCGVNSKASQDAFMSSEGLADQARLRTSSPLPNDAGASRAATEVFITVKYYGGDWSKLDSWRRFVQPSPR